jgi:hypothetical protein
MDMTAYTDKIKKFLKIRNYHAAVNIAISGLNECRRNDDQCGVDKFVSIIKAIAQTMAQEFGSLEKSDVASCFYCGTSRENAQLLVGANGSICSRCAEYAYSYFSGDKL